MSICPQTSCQCSACERQRRQAWVDRIEFNPAGERIEEAIRKVKDDLRKGTNVTEFHKGNKVQFQSSPEGIVYEVLAVDGPDLWVKWTQSDGTTVRRTVKAFNVVKVEPKWEEGKTYMRTGIPGYIKVVDVNDVGGALFWTVDRRDGHKGTGGYQPPENRKQWIEL